MPYLNAAQLTQEMISVFGGYDHNLKIQSGSFYRMKNLTSDHYPLLSPRKKRGICAKPAAPAGMIAKDSLCYVDGQEFVINGYPVNMGLSTEEEDCPKQLISMGAYVIILPDRMYINTEDLTDYGSIDARFQTQAPVTFSLCRVDGAEYQTEYLQATEPEEPGNMALWVDTSTVPHTLKQWSESSGSWVSIATTYIRIASAGIGRAFSQYDGISISGLADGDLVDNTTGEVLGDSGQIAALEGSAVVWDKGDDYIVVVGILDAVRTITNPVTISRQMPDMDFVVEAGNRLWGCRYGLARNGEWVNELYACKLGDFKNWNCFMSLSTDSYAASLGTDGPFTGAITYLGSPLFFKENCMHMVYGNYPSNFQIQETACRGVQKGCHRSLAIVGEVLYYKARHGVCAFDGSLPVEISGALGKTVYSEAVGGAHGSKYYISMKDSGGGYHLFVYDTEKQLWHREDELRADAFCEADGILYCLEHASGNILNLDGWGSAAEKKIEWMAETGPMGTDMPDAKFITKIAVRMSLDAGSRVRFFVEYDSCGRWEQIGLLSGTRMESFSLPLRLRRCDHFRLRAEGSGDAKIYSITKYIAKSSS